MPASIELEYDVPEGSDAVKEVGKCVEYCRRALAITREGELALEVLTLQPSEGRFEAGRVVDAWFPAEQLSRLASAEILVLTQHVHGLPREQRRRRWR